MKLALCNEVVRELSFERQCALAAALGYSGLEVAPFTLGAEPHRLAPAAVSATRRAAEAAGIAVTGLHWLLVTPEGLSRSEERRVGKECRAGRSLRLYIERLTE